VNLRWLWLDHVPPAIRLSTEERRRFTRAYRHLHSPRTLSAQTIGFSLGLIALVLWFVLLSYLAPRMVGIGGCFLAALMLGALYPAIWLLIAAADYALGRRRTYGALRLVGYDVCPRCGYWLRGLPEDEDRCPECGAKRQPMPEVQG